MDEVNVPAYDRAVAEAAEKRQASLTKPVGSLGRLETLAVRLAAIQGDPQKPVSRPVAALIAASDHGVADAGVSAYPQAVTRAMVQNIVSGGAASSVLANKQRIPLTVLDVGVLKDETSGQENLSERAIGNPIGVRLIRPEVADHPLGDLREAEAVSKEDSVAIRAAAAEAIAGIGESLNVLVLGEIGIANTTAAAAVVSALLSLPPSESVGPGTGVEGAGLERKRGAVDQALSSLGGDRDPWSVLRRVGGRDLLAMAAAAEAAIERGAAVLVDGYTASAAMLPLREHRSHLLFAHCSAEPAHRAVLTHFGEQPLLDLGMRLGEASGALAAFPLLDLACSLHGSMATFDEAKVPTQL